MIHMHRDILGIDGFVDHRNGDTLDNRRENLRPATRAQNAWNRGKLSTNRSGHKGVSKDADGRRWIAKIEVNGVRHRKAFKVLEEAAAWYREAALRLHGEFARLK